MSSGFGLTHRSRTSARTSTATGSIVPCGALRPPRVDITIDRVHLVSQYQHPDKGYYTWDTIEEFALG
ncbi:hypothetical protein AB0O76_29455 [Streptomyces sp. NPDC086554]|uniref:hypothetical protein n=1 Tax=Streptomyces sp. NPDC086554 TaxID=3154864 RepID=UPI00342770B2